MEYGNIGYETGKKCNFSGLKFKSCSNANDLYLQGKYEAYITARLYRYYP